MTAAVLGGISFKGGEGKMWGLVTGVLILGVLGNGLTQMSIDSYVREVLIGSIIVLAVASSSLGKAKG